MTAQIRPNRMEVSDRFPMLGFAVRTDEPNVEAEVVLASDIGLFGGQNRTRRTAANFYSSREHGTLTVPRGEGVFVVPPDVLARFIGSEKIYFGLATGHGGNGGLNVDAVPRDGSPYVSLRGFTGRTLRRSFGGTRGTSAPRLEWTGDAPKPGSEGANSTAPKASNGSGPAPATSQPAGSYDDGFGPMPTIPARGSAYHSRRAPVSANAVGITMSSGTTAAAALDWIRTKIEQGVQAAGSRVDPPSMYYLGDNSANFIRAWQIAFGATALFVPTNAFIAAIPSLAERSDVTLSIGPVLDTPLFGGGVGAVFAPDGQVALFGAGEISADFDGLLEFAKSLKLALTAKMKLGYNRGGLAKFADIRTVAGVNAGEEIVGGAEIWLDSTDSGIGGAVSIGVGFALQLGVREDRAVRGVHFVGAAEMGLPSGHTAIAMGSGTTADQALAWMRNKVEAIVNAVGDEVSAPYLYRFELQSAKFIAAWETAFGVASHIPGAGGLFDFLKVLPTLAYESGVTLSVGPAVDTPLFGGGIGVVFSPLGQAALFGRGEITLDASGIAEFISSLKASLQAKLKFGYNRGGIEGFARVSKVGSVAVGEEIVVGAEVWLDSSGAGLGGAVSVGGGFALQLAEQETVGTPAYVPPSLPSDPRQRANRIGGGFGQRIGEALDLGLDASTISPLLDRLDASLTPKPLSFSRGLGVDPWSINWDGVDLLPQPTDNGCWATTLAMLLGWRDQKSRSPQSIATQCGHDINNVLPWADRASAAQTLGLNTLQPQCYTPDGFGDLLRAYGPLYVGKATSSGSMDTTHAVLVVGMYFDGSDHFVRIHDSEDRDIGTPGSPGSYFGTHDRGTRYIMRYDQFANEYEMGIRGNPAYVQILYAGIPLGRTPNVTSGSAPAGFAMDARQTRAARKIPAGALEGGASGADWIQAGTAVIDTIHSISETDVSCQVEKYDGWHRPPQLKDKPLGEVHTSTAIVEWDDGGILDAIGLKLSIDWEHDGWSVGNVVITPFGFNDASGDTLTVKVTITPSGTKFNGITIPYVQRSSNDVQYPNAKDYLNNPGAMLKLTVSYQRGRMVRNDLTEGKKIYLLPTGQFTETEMALD